MKSIGRLFEKGSDEMVKIALRKRAAVKQPVWNVWTWNFNHDELELYDVVPTFIKSLKSLKKVDFPRTVDELSKFLDQEAIYYFWSKCEWEMVIHSWPMHKNEEKVDVYSQLKLNWDAFVSVLWKYIEDKNGKI